MSVSVTMPTTVTTPADFRLAVPSLASILFVQSRGLLTRREHLTGRQGEVEPRLIRGDYSEIICFKQSLTICLISGSHNLASITEG